MRYRGEIKTNKIKDPRGVAYNCRVGLHNQCPSPYCCCICHSLAGGIMLRDRELLKVATNDYNNRTSKYRYGRRKYLAAIRDAGDLLAEMLGGQ